MPKDETPHFNRPNLKYRNEVILTSPPDLLVVDLLQLLREVLTVSFSAVELERLAGLRAVAYRLVEGLEDGQVGLLEDGSPVESASASGGGACVVHVVLYIVGKRSEVVACNEWQFLAAHHSRIEGTSVF